MTANVSSNASPTHPPAARPRAARRPPGPKGLPLLGSLLDLGRDAPGFFTDCARRYGDVAGFDLAGWPAMLLSHPDFAEYVLVKNHGNFVKHRFFWRHLRALVGNGLLTSEGAFWHRQRRLVAPAFQSKQLSGYGAVMVRQAEHMLDRWRPGEVRDVHADMMALTLVIAAKTLFSADVEDDVTEVGRAANALIEEVASRYRRPFLIPDGVPIPGNLRYTRAVRRIDRLVMRIIREQRDRAPVRDDLLSMLLHGRDDDGRPMTERQIRDEVITLLMAGHETTAIALSWIWYLLSRHADVDARLAAEAEAVLGGRAPGTDDLPCLCLAEQVVTEAMRLYPPAWALGREALADCEIGGYAVPAGTTIFNSPWVLHRDPRYFERPAEFRPERWSGDFARRLPRFAYMPFGGGPRICVGNRFAIAEAMLILVTVAQRFRLEWQGEGPLVPLPSVTLRPKGGVRVKLVPRSSLKA